MGKLTRPWLESERHLATAIRSGDAVARVRLMEVGGGRVRLAIPGGALGKIASLHSSPQIASANSYDDSPLIGHRTCNPPVSEQSVIHV